MGRLGGMTVFVKTFVFVSIFVSLGACSMPAFAGDAAGIYRCRSPSGDRVFQDQPCRGLLRKDGTPDAKAPAWRLDRRQCVLRSPWVSLFTPPAPALEPAAESLEPAAEPLAPAAKPPEPTMLTQIRLELRQDLDGVVVQIRGFDPSSQAPEQPNFRFSAVISGQGIRIADEFFEVDAVAASNRLRFGFRKTTSMLSKLSQSPGRLQVALEIHGRFQQELPIDGLSEPLTQLLHCAENKARPKRN